MTTAAPPLGISLDGREFQTAGDSAGNPEQGGYDNEWAANGNPATGRVVQTPTGWRLTDQPIQIDLSAGDYEYINEKKNKGIEMDIVLTYQDAILGGTGIVEGKFSLDPMTATAAITLAGGGELEQL